MNTRALHHYWRSVSRVSAALLIAAFCVTLSLSIIALRNNNLQMIKLRDKVYAADKNNGDVEGSLRDLRAYVAGHMNTNLLSGANPIKPPIQLKYSYDRALATEKARVSTINDKVYNDAQNQCEQLFPRGLSGSGRVPCVQNYVTDHGAKENPISIDFYTFDFISPRFTLDFAGTMLCLAAIFGVLMVMRLFAGWAITAKLRDHL